MEATRSSMAAFHALNLDPIPGQRFHPTLVLTSPFPGNTMSPFLRGLGWPAVPSRLMWRLSEILLVALSKGAQQTTIPVPAIRGLKESAVKLSKSVAYPLASMAVVCAFWFVMAVTTKSDPAKSTASSAGQGSAVDQDQSADSGFNAQEGSRGTAANPLAASPRNPQAQDKSGGTEEAQSLPSSQPAQTQVTSGGAWLGLKLVEDESANFMFQGRHIQGLVVSDVYPGGPADQAGIEEDNLLMSIDGRPVRARRDVVDILSKLAPGARVPLEIFRESGATTVTVTLTTPPQGSGVSQLARVDEGADSDFSGPGAPAPGFGQGSGGVFINGRQLTPNQIQEIRSIYGVNPVPGRYWYDTRSGLYGYMGRETLGYIRPGHNFGRMPSNASNGNTGVFINGRQLSNLEVAYLRLLFGVVYTGRWWLDGNTGNIGQEGNPMPIANIYTAIRQRQGAGQQGGNYSWHSGITGAYGGSSGGCSYVSIPGSGTVSSGCD